MSAAVVLAAMVACRHPVQADAIDHPNPETTQRQIESLFIEGDLPAARLLAEAAYNSTPKDTPWSARLLIQRARILIYQGQTAAAAQLLSGDFEPGASPDIVIRRAILLGMAKGRLGDLSGSAASFAAAEARHPQGVLASELLGSRGSVELGQGHLDLAEPLFRNGLAIAEQENASFQQTQMLMNLGVVALQQQHYEDALDLFSRASSIADAIGAKLAKQIALANLGSIYYQTGDFIRGRDTSLQAATQAAAQGSSLSQATSLKNAGNSAFRLNELAAARSLYEQSLVLAQHLQSKDKIFDAEQALGYLLLSTDPTLAAIHIHEATRLAAERNHRGDQLEQQFIESLLLAQQKQIQPAIDELRRFDARPGALPSLYWQAEQNIAKLYDQLHDESQAELWFRRAVATFSRQRRSVHSIELQLPFLGNGDDLYFAYMDHLIQQGKTAQALTLLDQSRAETLAQNLDRANSHSNVFIANPQAVATRLRATILVYCLRPGQSYLWDVSPNRQTFYRLPGREVILPLLKRHSQAILASTDLLARKESTGHQLYNMLVQPAASLRTGPPGRRVYIIADCELHDLNFETLIPPPASAQEKPHYWIEDVTLINARSLRLLASSSAPKPQKQNALLIGDPIYRDTEYPALPNASTELNQIAQHFPAISRAVYSGPQAVPASYAASTPGAFSYIHFVAHATSNETSPLDSAIVLSKSPTQPFAYRLYARDILDQHLHANLVTLSACYGSGRRNYSGEGLVGLAWAFLRAGAHNVIGALWQVSDASTPQLMDRLYTGLLHGDPPDTALRAAKLATIHAGGAFRKPLYWAPFQIYSGS